MNQNVTAIWMAGLLMGTGGGLMIARSLPATSIQPQQETASTQNPQGNQLFLPNRLGSSPYLTDPLQFPELQQHAENSQFLYGEQSEPNAPRPFPQGKASPVLNNKQSQAKLEKLQPSAEFRKQLKDIAPEFSEKSINDLAKIRSIIEKDNKAMKPENELSEKQEDGK